MSPQCRIARWKASQDEFADAKGAFHNRLVVQARWLSVYVARRTGEARFDIYERLIAQWTSHWRNKPQ